MAQRRGLLLKGENVVRTLPLDLRGRLLHWPQTTLTSADTFLIALVVWHLVVMERAKRFIAKRQKFITLLRGKNRKVQSQRQRPKGRSDIHLEVEVIQNFPPKVTVRSQASCTKTQFSQHQEGTANLHPSGRLTTLEANLSRFLLSVRNRFAFLVPFHLLTLLAC